MKKVLLVIMILFLAGCSLKSGEYTEVSVSELKQKCENKDTFVLVLGSETCAWCQKYKTNMSKFIKDYSIEIFYLDADKLTEEQYNKIKSKLGGTYSTPTTIFIRDGVETSTYERISGILEYNEIVYNLKKLGYIGD